MFSITKSVYFINRNYSFSINFLDDFLIRKWSPLDVNWFFGGWIWSGLLIMSRSWNDGREERRTNVSWTKDSKLKKKREEGGSSPKSSLYTVVGWVSNVVTR